MALFWLGLGLTIGSGIINGVCYAGLTPTRLSRPPLAGRTAARLGAAVHAAAYGLTLARLPFGVAPYVLKVGLALTLRKRFEPWWGRPWMQALRVLGEGVNWGLTTALLLALTATAPAGVQLLAQLASSAEFTRLLLEKGQIVVSAGWQQLPHRRMAHWLHARRWRWVRSYLYYYRRSEAQRLAYVARLLRQWSARDARAAVALSDVRGFRVAPADVSLRTGQVRDVARGEIWVQPGWSNDPWLLIGLALRRSPWLFDPRHMRRPFFYRSEANPRATRLVLSLAQYSPPFALYQLGHEIKAARFEVCFRALRAMGVNLEAPVQADGTYLFDPFLAWMQVRVGQAPTPASRRLWTPAEALADLAQRPDADDLIAEVIAARYTFPVRYVEEVLLPAARQTAAMASATVSGASQ